MNIARKLRPIDEGYARAEQNSPYLQRDGMKITIDDLSWAMSGSVEIVSGTTLSVNFGELI